MCRSCWQKLKYSGFLSSRISASIPELREYVRKDAIGREISIATWGTHDHAPLFNWYHDLTRRWRGADGHEAWLELQRLMRFLGQDPENPPERVDEKLHEAFLRTLLEARSCWTVFVITDIIGGELQFNAPGTATNDNWSQRLDRPLSAFVHDPVVSPKLAFLRGEVVKTNRAPESATGVTSPGLPL